VASRVRRLHRAVFALGLATLAALLLGAHGCAAAAGQPVSGLVPPDQLTLTHAHQVFATFVTTQDVARSAGDERLELSLVSDAQVPLTVAAYENADFYGVPAPSYTYGPPRLYVPMLRGYPLWFVATAARTPARGGPARTAIMVFSRPTPDNSWQLALSTLLAPGMSLPQIALDSTGHALALATFEHGLLATPNSVGALQAAVAEDGPGSVTAKVMAPGPYTTGLHEQILSDERQVSRLGVAEDSLLVGLSFPIYALRTTDGGALVLYSMGLDSVILRRGTEGRQIEIPPAFAPILFASGNLVVRFELDTGATYEYAAHVPPNAPAGSTPRLIRVIAADGGPTTAGGS
jgi:hypothetical protein